VVLRETSRAVTPFGGVAVFIAYLRKIEWIGTVRKYMPVHWRSPNQIDPAVTLTAFLLAVLTGAKRFAQANWLRGDEALRKLLGLKRFPTDDTIRNLFKQFSMGHVQRFFTPLAEWQMERLPRREDGYTLDLDSTIFERYGQQEGVLKGYNPRKHGRPSHHPLLAVLSEVHFLLHGWLRSGNCGDSRGAKEFLARGPGAVGTTPEGSFGTRRLRLLRRPAAQLFGRAPAALYCSRAAHPVDQARGPARRRVEAARRQLRRGRVPLAAV
jgi:hypothetical protein